jgi:hypothetical protein
MEKEIAAALVGGGIGIVASISGSIALVWYQNRQEKRDEPILKMDYQAIDGVNKIESAYQSQGNVQEFVHIRARLWNDNVRPARNCRVFLTKLTEVHGTIEKETVYHDALQLEWAGGDSGTRDIPAGVNFYVNVVRVSKSAPGWLISTKLFASHGPLKGYFGVYRFHILATAENAPPSKCVIDVDYRGDWHNLRAWSPEP